MYISLHHLPGLFGPLLVPALQWALNRSARFRQAWAARDPLTRVVAILLLVAGAIHLALVPGHTGYPVQQTLFLVNAAAFGACFAAIFMVRWWRWPAALLLLATIVAYLVYVGSGKEELDEVGMISKLVELVALGLVLAPHRRRRRALRWTGATALFMAMIFMTGTVGYAAEFRPGAGHSHGGATGPPTPEQRLAAQRLVETTAAGIDKYHDPNVALADGYRPDSFTKAPSSHWTNERYQHDGHILDPQRPETLVYANTRHGPVLLGAMYMMESAGQPAPQPGGSLTVWHTHDNVCFTVLGGISIAGFMSPFGGCPIASLSVRTPQMMHVWIVPNPKGPFAEVDDEWIKKLDEQA